MLVAGLAGLLAGPRWPAVVVAVAGGALAAAVALARSGRAFAVPLAGPAAAGDGGLAAPSPVVVPAQRLAAVAATASLAVLAGAVWADERLAALDRSALRPAADARVRGVVVEPPRVRSFGTTVVSVRLHRPREGVLVRAPSRVRLPRLAVGDEIAARGRLRPLRPREEFERRRGVHAVIEAERVMRTGRRDSPVDGVRRRAEAALATGLAPEQAALARGMVLGQDQALAEDLRDAFRASGLAHLLAASGQNVMLLAALVLALLALAGVPLRARLGCAVLAIAAYVPLAGAGPSIQRAGVMGAAGLVAAMASRPASRWHALLLAATATLAANPRAAEDPGWQLSFAAVIAIVALHRLLRAALVRHRVPGAGADVVALTVAATVGTAPLLALHFGEVSLVSLPANVLAAPAVAPVMWLGALAGVCGGLAARLLNDVAALPLAYLAWLARTAAAAPGATVAVGVTPAAAALAYALIAAACTARRARAPAALRGWAEREAQSVPAGPRARAARAVLRAATAADRTIARLVAAGVLRRVPPAVDAAAAGAPGRLALRWATVTPLGVACLAGALLAAPGPPRPPDDPTLSLLDVGQGDAVLLQDGPAALLFDTGPPGAPLVRELRRAGVRRLAAVVITHSSADHEGGLPGLLGAMPVGLVLDGRGPGREHGGEGGGARFEGLPPGQARGVPEAGQVLRAGRIEVEILWPPPEEERRGDPNLTATVALVRAGGATALLPADAESPVTLPLELPRVDVLKVAHHGSADPGLPALLERTRPRTVLIPVGRNTYGHPAASTLAALAGVRDLRRTDRDGTVRVPLAAPTAPLPPPAR